MVKTERRYDKIVKLMLEDTLNTRLEAMGTCLIKLCLKQKNYFKMMINSDIINIFKQNFSPVYRLLKSNCKKIVTFHQ